MSGRPAIADDDPLAEEVAAVVENLLGRAHSRAFGCGREFVREGVFGSEWGLWTNFVACVFRMLSEVAWLAGCGVCMIPPYGVCHVESV